jgi:hypothetical protein
MTDLGDAQRRVDQIRAFRAELEALKQAGALPLSAAQERELTQYHDTVLDRLAADYDVDRTDTAGQLSRGMQVLSFFAALALTAALYSLVARYWGQMNLPLQATLLAMFPLMALAGTEFAARRERTLYIASIFALVAYGTFWLAVGALGWTLNIPPTPSRIWAGAVFGFALALPYGFRIVLGVALLALILAPAASLFQSSGVPWDEAFRRPEPLAFAAFSVTLLASRLRQIERGFAVITRLVGFGIGLLAMLVLSLSGAATLLPMSVTVAEAFYQVAMFVVSVALISAGIRRRWTETVNLAAVMLTLFLLTRFLDWFWNLLPRFAFFLILALLAFVWLWILRRVRARIVEVQP